MKLLLDEMHPLAVAVQLRRRGHDVIGVAERDGLRSQPDEALLTIAQTEGRVIVTENVDDFRGIAARLAQGGESHAGIVFTTNAAFHRGRAGTIGRLVRALDSLLASDPDLTDLEVWLSDWS